MRESSFFLLTLQIYKGLIHPVTFSSIFSTVSCDTRPIMRQIPATPSKTVANRRYFDYDYDLFVHRDTETQSFVFLKTFNQSQSSA